MPKVLITPIPFADKSHLPIADGGVRVCYAIAGWIYVR